VLGVRNTDYHSPLTTHHSPLITHHSPLITHHLSHITWHNPYLLIPVLQWCPVTVNAPPTSVSLTPNT